MWTLPKEVGDLVAMNANRSEVFKMFFALVFANQTSALAKKKWFQEKNKQQGMRVRSRIAGDGLTHSGPWALTACR